MSVQEESFQGSMTKAEGVSAIRARSISADDLQRIYLDEIYAYASRRLRRREDAEDATADTFAAAFSHIKRLRGRDPRLWLLGIARRKVIDIYRRHKRRPEVPLHEIEGLSGLSDDDRDDVAEVRRLVLALPADQREVLMLQHIEGFSQSEIAAIMGKSKAAINSLQQRARANVLRDGKGFFLTEVQL